VEDRVEARPLAGLLLERVHDPGELAGRALGLDAVACLHRADGALVGAGDEGHGGADHLDQRAVGVVLLLQGAGQLAEAGGQLVVVLALGREPVVGLHRRLPPPAGQVRRLPGSEHENASERYGRRRLGTLRPSCHGRTPAPGR